MKQTTTLRIDHSLVKRIDLLIHYKKFKYPTRSAFICEAIEVLADQLQSHLMHNLTGEKKSQLKNDLQLIKKLQYEKLIEDRKKELRSSLNSYFSRDKVQRLIDTEKYEVAKWLYDEYNRYCEEHFRSLDEPFDRKYNL